MLRVRLQVFGILLWLILSVPILALVLGERGLYLVFYALIMGASTVMLFIPVLAKQDIKISLGAVFALATLTSLITYTASEPKPEIPYLGIGIIVVLITFMLIRWLIQTVFSLESDAKGTNKYSPLSQGFFTTLEGEMRINDELYRARRFSRPEPGKDMEHPVAFIYCTLSSYIPQYKEVLATAIAGLVYKGDFVVDYGDGLIVALPENDTSDATIFIADLVRAIKLPEGVHLMVSKSNFPEDGMVCEDLVTVARLDPQPKVPSEDDYPHDRRIRKGGLLIELEDRLQTGHQAEWVKKMSELRPEDRATYLRIKRIIDVGFVLMLAPVLLPVMLIIAFLIRLDDGDKIFYMQSRTGYRGKPFLMYKFRSMRTDAKYVPPVVKLNEDGSMGYTRLMWPEKVENDRRITRVGRILRKTSLDELPQFLNILKGDMSLIGPRPTTWDLDKYTPYQRERLTIRPGITGLWQVSDRDATNFDTRLYWDLLYIEKVNLWLDIRIVWETVMGVFKKSGV